MDIIWSGKLLPLKIIYVIVSVFVDDDQGHYSCTCPVVADQSDVYSHVLRRLCHRLGTGGLLGLKSGRWRLTYRLKVVYMQVPYSQVKFGTDTWRKNPEARWKSLCKVSKLI